MFPGTARATWLNIGWLTIARSTLAVRNHRAGPHVARNCLKFLNFLNFRETSNGRKIAERHGSRRRNERKRCACSPLLPEIRTGGRGEGRFQSARSAADCGLKTTLRVSPAVCSLSPTARF